MKKIDFAHKMNRVYGYSISTTYKWLDGTRFTESKEAAIALSEFTGKKPITFIKKSLRKTYKKAFPELDKIASAESVA